MVRVAGERSFRAALGLIAAVVSVVLARGWRCGLRPRLRARRRSDHHASCPGVPTCSAAATRSCGSPAVVHEGAPGDRRRAQADRSCSRRAPTGRSRGSSRGFRWARARSSRARAVAARGSSSPTIRLAARVFSGPQLQPWACQSTATDAQCNQPPSYSFLYKSTDPTKSGFQTYDPKSPPSDVATTTTDQGVTVPFIVRVETGYVDRDQYQIATLFDPAQQWSATSPRAVQPQAPAHSWRRVRRRPPRPARAPRRLPRRGRARRVASPSMSNALDNAGHNCNVAPRPSRS